MPWGSIGSGLLPTLVGVRSCATRGGLRAYRTRACSGRWRPGEALKGLSGPLVLEFDSTVERVNGWQAGSETDYNRSQGWPPVVSGADVENHIQEAKADLGSGHIPRQSFHVNAAVIKLRLLAHNQILLFSRSVPGQIQPRSRVSTIRRKWLSIAAKFVRDGRRRILSHFGTGSSPEACVAPVPMRGDSTMTNRSFPCGWDGLLGRDGLTKISLQRPAPDEIAITAPFGRS